MKKPKRVEVVVQGYELRCGKCGELFVARRPDATFCGPPCKQAAYRERAKKAAR